jgi:hypothetical protein
VDRNITATFVPLKDQVDASLLQERMIATLSGFFGGLALLPSGLGLYGVTAYAVNRVLLPDVSSRTPLARQEGRDSGRRAARG